MTHKIITNTLQRHIDIKFRLIITNMLGETYDKIFKKKFELQLTIYVATTPVILGVGLKDAEQ